MSATTIDLENAKSYRKSMEVYCGLTSRTSEDLTFKTSGSFAMIDTNLSTALDNENWNMRKLADLHGDGFLLDGSCETYTEVTSSNDNGKIGIRSNVGDGFSVTITSTTILEAITIAFVENSIGTITVGETTYTVQRATVIPVNAKTITLVIANGDANSRIEIASITPGISLAFDNNNLISCDLNLRSDLSIDNPSWQISDIEINAYYADDISEVVAKVNDDVPIWYYAGYDGDYSTERKFYLSESVTQSGNQITIKGEDASHKLEDASDLELSLYSAGNVNGKHGVCSLLSNIIKSAGITVESTDRETIPAYASGASAFNYVLTVEQSPRDLVQDIINLSHTVEFKPRFVDAGIPTLNWTSANYQYANRNGKRPIWKVYISDCYDNSRVFERFVSKITSDSDYGLTSIVSKNNTWITFESEIKIEKDVVQKKTFSDYYVWAVKVNYISSTIKSALNYFTWKPSKTSAQVTVKTSKKYTTGSKKGQYKTKKVWRYRPNFYVKKLVITKSSNSTAIKRAGTTLTVTPQCYGKFAESDGTRIYPNYNLIFNRSNVTGNFSFKGDPRMQPRDIFWLYDKTGTNRTLCTIESINLVHEGGGTTATITYREGSV